MMLAVLLLVAVVTSQPPAVPAPPAPVTIGQVTFQPADLAVSFEHIVAPGVTYYCTRIVWHFSDDSTIEERIEPDPDCRHFE